MADAETAPRIYVLAGTNGAGKSSIGGAMLLAKGTEYFNPDEATRRIVAFNPAIALADANSAAWHEGVRLLQRAIDERLNYAFETTLGGHTVTTKLHEALAAGLEVRIWYVGLRSPELHIARVRARVARGGHAISEAKIRERYDQSRLNLIGLAPVLTELMVFDNSKELDPHTGAVPRPMLVLHLNRGKMTSSCELSLAPEWAKPILAAVMKGGGEV